MALVAESRSSLNPNAPLFIPAAYRQVEDFSPEWWALVKSSPWFRDFWLSQHPLESFEGNAEYDDGNEEVYDFAEILADEFDFGFDLEFTDMETQFEDFVAAPETGGKTELGPTERKGRKPLKGLETNTKDLLIELNVSKSPKEKGSKFPSGPSKFLEKPTKCVSPKFSPRRIQQPR